LALFFFLFYINRPPKAERGTIPTCVEGLIHLFQSCWKALKTDGKRGNFFIFFLIFYKTFKIPKE